MFRNFKISAPGRLYLCGEHMVMYGKHVLATSIDLRTTLKFNQLADNSMIWLQFPNTIINLNIPTQLINHFIDSANYSYLVDDNIMFLRHVQYFITVNGMWRTYAQRFSLQTFFFMYLYICHHENIEIKSKSFHVYLSTVLPIGAGLGSSTSFAVCLAACFIHWGCLQRGDHSEFTNRELEKISEYAMLSEEVIQNYVFGADYDVCTNGQRTLFQYRELINSDLESLDMQEMQILLIYSKIDKDKREQMRKVAAMKNAHADAVDEIMNRINNISLNVHQTFSAIKASNNEQQLQELYTTLQNQITENQEHLSNLNLSDEYLNRISAIAREFGLAGKLTGFEGTYAFILLPPNVSQERVCNVCERLTMNGFNPIRTKIGSPGVRIEGH